MSTPTTAAIAHPDRDAIAATAASILLEIKALHFNAEKPFIFTSGWASPVYTDCRRIISFPRARRALMDFAVATIQREIGFESVDAVAGGETAGIPFAAWIADLMGLPMQYIRKKPKGFGRNAQIEGVLGEGQRVLLVEDLATDGKSKENFVTALRTAGAQVTDTFVVFHYGIFPQSKQTMEAMGVRLHALCTWWDVLEVARRNAYFDANTLNEVEKFLHNPIEWSAAHGGKASFD
ncbi:orotate phosphoribosyltransferase [Azospirillum sp. ST 5-10]|uniref:orotate phosphoribosyltransferase n=1 Tax=unclassified Azospirillum TaxID=2630922 RepID=UPI003F49B943